MKSICGKLTAVLLAMAMLFPAAIPIQPAYGTAEDYLVREEFAWVSIEDMLKGPWSVSSLHPAEDIDAAAEGSMVTMRSTGKNISFTRTLEKTICSGIYCFDLSYIQQGGAFSWGFSGGGTEITVAEQTADGTITAGRDIIASNPDNAVFARVMVNFDGSSISVEIYRENGIMLGEKTVEANLSGGIDAFFLRFSGECPVGAGASFAYLYGWQGNGTERAVTLDENPMTGKMYSTIYEDNFGYTSEEELAAAGYSFTGSAADGELTVEDGYPKISRLTADGGTVTLNMPIPTEKKIGYKLDGKIRASLTYQLPTNQIMRVYQKWKSVDVDENITATELTDGIMKRTRLYLRTGTATEWRVHTSDNNGGIRPLVMELDFDNKVANAEMRISGAANPTSSKDMRTETEYNSNLYALDIELRGGSNGAIGNYLKVTTWKLEKELELQDILTKAASKIDLSGIASDIQAVTENLSLPVYSEGLNLSWKSLNPELISDSGQVMRPQDMDEKAVMIMTAEYQGSKIQRAVSVIVKAVQPSRLYFVENSLSNWKVSGTATILDGGISITNGSAALEISPVGYFKFGGRGKLQMDISSQDDAEIILYCDDTVAAEFRMSDLGINNGNIHTLRFVTDSAESKLAVLADGVEKTSVHMSDGYLTGAEITGSGSFWIANGMAWIDYDDVPESLLNSLTWDLLSIDMENMVYKDLVIPLSPVPVAQISFASANAAIDGDGKVIRGGEDVSGAVTVTAALTDNPQVSCSKDFLITVAKRNLKNETPNSVMSSTIQPISGSSLADLADDDPTTAFETQGAEKLLTLQFDLGEVKMIGFLTMIENSGTVTNIRVETAEDNDYVTVYDGEPEKLSINISKGRYVRVTIRKNTGALKLAELTIESGYSDEQAVAADMDMLEVPDADVLNESFSIPDTGKWGSSIAVTSGSSAIKITKNGASYTIAPIPQQSTEVVSICMTFTKNDAKLTRMVSYTVRGTGSGSSGGGISGGSGSVYQAQSYSPLPETTGSVQADDEQNENIADDFSFPDVSKDYWARPYIDALCRDGILTGFEDGRFLPEDFVTREQFIKMLLSAVFPDKISVQELKFEDTAPDEWYYPYVSTGAALGIVQGISDTMFGTGEFITREDLAVMTVRALKSGGVQFVPQPNLPFADAGDISDYAKEAIAALCGQEILQGDEEGHFAPLKNATRAEAAKIICMVQALQ